MRSIRPSSSEEDETQMKQPSIPRGSYWLLVFVPAFVYYCNLIAGERY